MRLARLVTPEGTTMDDWRIAAELALRFGTDFGLETVEDVQDEIARVAPAYAGVDAALLEPRTRRSRRADRASIPTRSSSTRVAGVSAGVSWEPIRPTPPRPTRRPRRRRPRRPVRSGGSARPTSTAGIGMPRPRSRSRRTRTVSASWLPARSTTPVAPCRRVRRSPRSRPGPPSWCIRTICHASGSLPRATPSASPAHAARVEVPVHTDTAVAPGTCFMPFAQDDVGRPERSRRRDQRRSPSSASRRLDEAIPGDEVRRVTGFATSDPLFSDGVDLTVVLIVIGKTIAVFVLVLLSVLMYIWFLRKVIARMQNRIGPDRAGPFGLLQTLADGIKLFFKEQSVPTTADRKIFFLAPYLSLLPAFLAFAVVPIGGVVTIAGHETFLQLADLPARRFCGSSRCRVSASTACCSPAGRRGRSIRCSARCAPRRSSSATKRRSRSRSSVCSSRRTRSPRVESSSKQGWHGIESIFNGDWYWLPAIVALVGVPDRRRRRDEPPAVRSRGGRAGAHRRILHRVHGHPVRDLLPRRVHEPHHDVARSR